MTAIMADLWEHSEKLLQQEMQLALSELDVRLDKSKTVLRRAAISGGLMHAAYLSTLATLVLILSEFLRPWLAAFLVAAGASAAAYVFVQLGKKAADEAKQPSQPTDRFRAPGQTAHS